MSEPKPVVTGEQVRMTDDDVAFLAECEREAEAMIRRYAPSAIDTEDDEANADIASHFRTRVQSFKKVQALVASIVSGETVVVKRRDMEAVIHGRTEVSLGVAYEAMVRWLTPATQAVSHRRSRITEDANPLSSL